MVTLFIIFTNMTIRVKGRFLSVFSVAITEYLRLGKLKNKGYLFYNSRSWNILDQAAAGGGVLFAGRDSAEPQSGSGHHMTRGTYRRDSFYNSDFYTDPLLRQTH